MIYVKDFRQGKLLFEALDSDVRLGILEEILEKGELNLAYFAKRFNVSNGAITAHVKKLLAAGLIHITSTSGVRGTQKLCSITTDKLMVEFSKPLHDGKARSAKIGVGHFTGYDVHSVCGLASPENMIGEADDPAVFSYPDRIHAEVLWLGTGYVEYLIPNFVGPQDELEELQFSLELSLAECENSEGEGDVRFSLNGYDLGIYTCVAEKADREGIYSPDWWKDKPYGYGKKVVVCINHEGTFIGGMRISDVSIGTLRIASGDQIKFRIGTSQYEERCAGFTLFGKDFGDYGEEITARFIFK